VYLLYIAPLESVHSCPNASVSRCVASFNFIFANDDLSNCHSLRDRRFSWTSLSICTFVYLWLFVKFLLWGVRTRAAETKTDSSVLVKLFMPLTLFSRGLISMCEPTNFLNLRQFVLFDFILEELSLVYGHWCRLRSTGEWSDDLTIGQ